MRRGDVDRWIEGNPDTAEARRPLALRPEDITVGRVYRAKRPRSHGRGIVNDRTVVWVSEDRTRVQYDGPAVDIGKHFPTVDMAAFLTWAREEVIPDPATEPGAPPSEVGR